MPEIYVDDMRNGYRRIADWVIKEGDLVYPRGLLTKEITNATIVLLDPRDTLPVGINRRGYSTRFAACEAAQLIGGVSDVDLTLRINSNMRQFLDEDLSSDRPHFHGAYGPRARYGLIRAVERLKEDPQTRQAVVTIFDSANDLQTRWKDVPCTLSLHLYIRRHMLNLTTTMRSNDVWWGLAYDVFQFTQLQLTVLNVLNAEMDAKLELGVYTHNAHSLHIYERDYDGIKQLKTSDSLGPPNFVPEGFEGATIIEAQERARMIIADPLEPVFSESEEWYKGKLHG